MLLQYRGYIWFNFGYEILVAISPQFFVFGHSGLPRRLVIYPGQAMWSSTLPTLALNRALFCGRKKEAINGWTLTRFKFFNDMLCSHVHLLLDPEFSLPSSPCFQLDGMDRAPEL